MNNRVEIMEVGLRDGLQNVNEYLSIKDRLFIIEGLISAGIKNIQVASFVNPKIVPQMIEAEDLVKRISQTQDIEFSGLIFNEKGIERAMDCGIKKIETSISISERYSKKNLAMDVNSSLIKLKDIVKMAKKNSLKLRAGLQCVWGYENDGYAGQLKVLERLKQIIGMGVKRISLCDTAGMATPNEISSLLEMINKIFSGIEISIHLHNKNGLGLVNIHTALNFGIKIIDTSLGGIGGSPFIKDSKGNIGTEDTVYLLDSLGYDMGIDIRKISKLSKFLEKKIGSSYFGGKMYKLI
ncbi:MAG: hydroxymethylglutaryl-CoA lyase [Candidatus Neomarinimicrobiota bacterium]